MELGVHQPLVPFGDEPLSLRRLARTVDSARDGGFAAVSSNDHLVFRAPWLDGLTALASMVERSAPLALATTVALPVVRGPVALAKALAALDVLSDGRLEAGLGPGSSRADYDAAGISFEQRWRRFDEALAVIRALLGGGPPPRGLRHYPQPVELAPAPHRDVPLWVASWGSRAGLARVARAGDGWLASAYNTTPARFEAARAELPRDFPCALATMWTWITDDRGAAERMLVDVLAPFLNRDPDALREQVCVGSAEHCGQLLSRYAAAGCRRVYVWPLGDEQRQLARIAGAVAPLIGQ